MLRTFTLMSIIFVSLFIHIDSFRVHLFFRRWCYEYVLMCVYVCLCLFIDCRIQIITRYGLQCNSQYIMRNESSLVGASNHVEEEVTLTINRSDNSHIKGIFEFINILFSLFFVFFRVCVHSTYFFE